MKSKALLLCAAAAAIHFAPCAAAQDRADRRALDRDPRWQTLSDGERAKLRAAHDRALQDAQVRAARERLIEARRQYRDVMRPALLKADPSVQPILEKLRPRHRGRD